MQYNLGFTLCQSKHLLVTSYKWLANREDPDEIYFGFCSICPICLGIALSGLSSMYFFKVIKLAFRCLEFELKTRTKTKIEKTHVMMLLARS